MNLETRIYASPSSGSLPSNEGPQVLPENPLIGYEDILHMDGEQLYNYIENNLGKAEEEMYGPTSAEAKLIFICGDHVNNPGRSDIKDAVTVDGSPIYKDRSILNKISEIDEWIGVAGQVMHEGGKMKSLVSESADLFYNLIRLSSLDSNEIHPHMPNYNYIMGQIAGSLGWSKEQALLITAIKYHRRLVDVKKKDPEEEKKAMEELIAISALAPNKEPRVSTPSDIQINNTWNLLEQTRTTTLNPRRYQIVEGHKNRQNGHIYDSW